VGQKLYKEFTENRKAILTKSTQLSNVFEVLLDANDD
jgi:hypothetical protein